MVYIFITCIRTRAAFIHSSPLHFHSSSSWDVAETQMQRRYAVSPNQGDSRDESTTQFKKLSRSALIRGEKYKATNSTLPSPQSIAIRLGVKPTKDATSKTWKRAWKMQKRMIPILHSTDSCKPPDSSLNIACMWWKALSGNDKNSPVYDDGLAYDLLPSGWRKIASPRMNRFFPRLHHGNVELRTAYLDNAVREIVKDAKDPLLHSDSHVKIRLVCMGAGYDTRGVKMLEQGIVDMVVELDLPEVVDAKQRLFERLRMRRPGLVDVDMPELIPSDFNDVPDVEKKLQQVLKDDTNGDWHTIFMFEGVMIYLNDGVPSSLLNVTSNALIEKGLQGSLCLADRLENVPGGDQDMGGMELERNGWRIIDWCPKPGLARHMLRARLEATK